MSILSVTFVAVVLMQTVLGIKWEKKVDKIWHRRSYKLHNIMDFNKPGTVSWSLGQLKNIKHQFKK